MLNFKSYLLIVIGLIVGAGLFFTFNTSGSSQVSDSIQNQSYSVIDISTDNASIIVKPSKNSTTSVELEGDSKKIKKQILSANVKGDKLKIKVKEKRWFWINFDFSFKSVELVVTVPEKEYKALTIESSNGRIQMEDLHVTSINAETNNGRIVMDEVVSSDTKIKTNNGRIELYEVKGKIVGKSDNGRIYYEADGLKDDVELNTHNGRILVVLDKEPNNATFTATSHNGKVEIFGQSTNSMTFGNGNPTMKLKSSNGRVTVSTGRE